jgi:hypothetical protein
MRRRRIRRAVAHRRRTLASSAAWTRDGPQLAAGACTRESSRSAPDRTIGRSMRRRDSHREHTEVAEDRPPAPRTTAGNWAPRMSRATTSSSYASTRGDRGLGADDSGPFSLWRSRRWSRTDRRGANYPAPAGCTVSGGSWCPSTRRTGSGEITVFAWGGQGDEGAAEVVGTEAAAARPSRGRIPVEGDGGHVGVARALHAWSG